jgi:hypothetical protein
MRTSVRLQQDAAIDGDVLAGPSEHHGGAIGGQPPDDCPPDPARPAGDNRTFPGKLPPAPRSCRIARHPVRPGFPVDRGFPG